MKGKQNMIPIIKESNPNWFDEYKALGKDKQFIYDTFLGSFVAIKINNEYAAFLNGLNNFIIAKAYKNCLSIGEGTPLQYGSYKEVMAAALGRYNDMVKITCYGKTDTMERKAAIRHYSECIANSEGSERERYTTILMGLEEGKTEVTDEPETSKFYYYEEER
ncbi:hypothetical protein IKQ26_05180 [bacterium]|nr:hypothetical protein [bacterium]